MSLLEAVEPRRLLAAVVLQEEVSDFGNSEFADDVAVQRDDRIVVLGHTENAPGGDRLFLARYDIDGTLDPFFGENGRISGEFDAFRRATSLAIDRSGRMIVAGVTNESNPRIGVMRFTRSGFLDTSFGNGGLATLDAGSGEAVNDVAVDSSGRVTVAGQTLVSTTTTSISAFMAARFDSIGQPDFFFGGGDGDDFSVGDGVVVIPVGVGDSAATSVLLDGSRIILGGFATEQEAGLPAERRFALLRLESFGNLDDDFGEDDGIVVTDVGLPSVITDIARAKNGRIVAVGNTQPTDETVGEQILVARYERGGGTLDPTFGGGDGLTISAFGGARSNLAREAVVDNKDRVLLAGEISDAGEPTGDLNDDQFLLARYLADGTPDAGFGPEGAIINEVRQGLDSFEQVAGIGLQRDGKDGRVIVAGNTGTSGADQDLAVVRYATDATQGTGQVVLKGTRLVVRGTDRGDVITVAPNVVANTIEVTINGALTSVPAGGITRMTVGCRDGDDEASSSLGSEIISTLRGEDGDDDLRFFGDADGRIEGGDDDDDIEGGRFGDRLRGGRGDDLIFGGDGDDDIEGDSGFDRLFGEDGDDDLKADDGFEDDVDGGSGDDEADVDLFDFITRVDDVDFD